MKTTTLLVILAAAAVLYLLNRRVSAQAAVIAQINDENLALRSTGAIEQSPLTSVDQAYTWLRGKLW